MQSPVKVPLSLGVSAERQTPNELIHLIRKLRWMGMEDDAKIIGGAPRGLSRLA